jgi:acetyl esterase
MALPLKIRLFLKLTEFTQPPMHLQTPAAARHHTDKGMALGKLFFDKLIRVSKVEDLVATGRHGDIPVRIYYPTNPEEGRIVVYYHGGGFVINNVENYDLICRRLCEKLGAVVVSVEYRLAPENKFPIPVEDCLDAALWVYRQAIFLGGSPNKIILMGDSAGGNLATVVCQLLRDEGAFTPAAQVLIYPAADSSYTYPSEYTYAEGYLLSKAMKDWFQTHYERTVEDRKDPRMSPLLAPNLGGLPPAFVLTAAYDPLKDEGATYADALNKAGTPVWYVDYPGLIHGFITFPLLSKTAIQAIRDIGTFVEKYT